MSAALPSRKAWKDEWTKTGAEGGMGATALESWSERRSQSRDLARRSELNARVSEEARRDLEELTSSYRTVKKRRACPAGTPPAELWTMLLHASRNLSPAGLGIGYQRKQLSQCAPYLCWRDFCAELGLLALHRWRGTTALEPYCTRATRQALRGIESFMCCLQWESNS